MDKKTVTCKETKVTQTDLILPNDLNNHSTLFGGVLMKKIDAVASIAAHRFCRRPTVTASTDSVDFLSPVTSKDSICLEAFVSYSGTSSMEIFVKAVAENLLTAERRIAATAFLTFVALGEDGKPTKVPQIVPEKEEEILLFESGKGRSEERKLKRSRSKAFAEKLTTKRSFER